LNVAAVVARLRRLNIWHVAAGAFLLGLFVLLAFRASVPDRWSGWAFGDAQTMLSTRNWNERGWLNNFLLFCPQGCAKVTTLLDEPPLRQHAHGIMPYGGHGVGPRLWYTHYPPGYLVSYATLATIGLDGMESARILSVVMSLAGLGLFYFFLARLIRPAVAFWSCAVYGLNPTFLNYADSLANVPIDDLLRYGFMVAVLFSTRAATARGRSLATASAWLIQFGLSLASFDSVFFIYIWLVGWDYLDRQGFRWRRYLFFALAPLCAHGLQLAQNAWYLGWRDALLDAQAMFLLKSEASNPSRLRELGVTLDTVLDFVIQEQWLLWSIVILYVVRRAGLRTLNDRPVPSIALLTLLFLAGLGYLVVLPQAGRMGYQGHQMLPFYAVAVGGLIVSAADMFSHFVHGAFKPRWGVNRRHFELSWLLAATVCLMLFGWWLGSAQPHAWRPPDPPNPDQQLARGLCRVSTAHEPVYFNLEGLTMYWNHAFLPGYPQIHPIVEYDAGRRLMLSFNSETTLAADLKQLLHRAGPGSFSPVLISRDPERLRKILDILCEQEVITQTPQSFDVLHARYVLDLTPHLR